MASGNYYQVLADRARAGRDKTKTEKSVGEESLRNLETLVDRATLATLCSQDKAVFVARFDGLEKQEDQKIGSVERFVKEKVEQLGLQQAGRRNMEREDRGEFLRTTDPIQLIGEILQLQKKEQKPKVFRQEDREEFEEEQNIVSSSYAQLLKSQVTLHNFNRLFSNQRGEHE